MDIECLLTRHFKEVVIICVLIMCMTLVCTLVYQNIKTQQCNKVEFVNGHNCEESNCSKLLWRDYHYTVLILFLAIVFICTLAFSENNNVVNYISFAATLSSMILSVLAIILTLLDSSKMDANKTKIDNIVVDLQKIASDYRVAKENLDKSFVRLEDVISEMDTRLNSKLNEMNENLRKPLLDNEWKQNTDWNGDNDVSK